MAGGQEIENRPDRLGEAHSMHQFSVAFGEIAVVQYEWCRKIHVL